ncbi:glycosyltransferase family 2 protein [Budviciaceae bacterium CWB-B4]|uniref:Glycosyltransferase family 2 protein n=1 Tax=Limnobaculum xujianqingii TaxID=2738837 RepID=A0A9D7AL62_9GAMM|nr:glycosyltransferase family 2 protein [Limnobaculum xujianqingii]MBK5074419.1 glycosyltransferase family 2 protein [Limnobaculum xujianqingii]MBK5177915.1 glycosyltransferase family 2 protein [Limnobaculum xujianqingii]
MNQLNLSICIVTYESLDLVKTFHRELNESLNAFFDYEILYFDNSQSDLVFDFLSNNSNEHQKLYRDKRNMGFSYANNQLILKSRYEKILLLNPDVFGLTAKKWVDIVDAYKAETAMFVRLLNPDYSFQNCIGEVTSWKRTITKNVDYSLINSEVRIGMGIMAFMLADKNTFSKVGILDCSYALYSEDMDWCYRANKLGISVIYNPKIELIHIGGGSAKSKWSERVTLRKKYLAERIFIRKHYSGVNRYSLLILNYMKILLKTVV